MKKDCTPTRLDRLPLDQMQQLMAWLTTGGPAGCGLTYEQVADLCSTRWGVRTTARALEAFYRSHRGRQQPRIESSYDPAAGILKLCIHLSR